VVRLKKHLSIRRQSSIESRVSDFASAKDKGLNGHSITRTILKWNLGLECLSALAN